MALTKTHATLYLKKEKGVIVVESFDTDCNRNVAVRVSAEYSGKCTEVMIDTGRMMVLLGQIDYQTINLAIEAPYQPIIITTDSDTSYRALTMPLAISK